jgi:hypothetical protein
MRKLIVGLSAAILVLSVNGTAAAKEGYEITVGETFTYAGCWQGLNANSKVKLQVKRGETWKVVSTSQPRRSSECDAEYPWLTSYSWQPVSSGLFTLREMVRGSSNEFTLRVKQDTNATQTPGSSNSQNKSVRFSCVGQYPTYGGGVHTVYHDYAHYFPGRSDWQSSKQAVCNNWARTGLSRRAYAENLERCGSSSRIPAACSQVVSQLAASARAWPA